MRANSGDSSSERRKKKLRTPPSPPMTNASRQPSHGTISGGSHVRTPRLMPVATATPKRHAGEDDAAHKRRMPRRGFDHIGERARQFATQTEALDRGAGSPSERWRRDAPRGKGRHEPHPERGRRHHEQREQEHAAAAVPVAEVAEDDAADRTGEVADGKGGKRRQQRDQRRWSWERSRRRCPWRRHRR